MLEILWFDSVEIGDVPFHVLDNLYLFGIKVEPPFFGRGINRFPFGKGQEHIFPTETP